MGMEGGGNFLILLSDSALIGLDETVDFPFFFTDSLNLIQSF